MQIETFALAVAVATALTYFFLSRDELEDSLLLGFLASGMWAGIALVAFDVQKTVAAFNETGGVFETATVELSDPAIVWAFIFVAVVIGALALMRLATVIVEVMGDDRV